ncbi:anti-sigma-D factor RsdA [Mycolicibacterium neoaurum]|uniref:anti-sigma-D factor RsdA n=1 Tax=Mycolicibacterium neoaurum TaxID=1795 RepID=UPI00248C651F|nr:anti-sigma-D factor RsdA [Mycolicibacterium neoaurum]WBP96462.1 anti-sigma-D factor RsdA [Mycolicibacterium neoaurum]WBS10007.1 anti-sigma-D factor RsdA [Mycolicibacterium neoaurum]
MPDFGRWTANGGDPSLNDINRADRFLDALAGEQPVYSTDRGDAELAALLSGWRDEVRHVPMDHVVSPSQATAALVDATNRPTTRSRFGLAVVGSAAAAVLCLGGFGTAVFAAGPGDGLYGIRTMIFGEERATRDDAVVLAAQTELAQVQQLVDNGQWDQAQEKLAALSSTVQSVGPVEQKQDLIQQWNALTYKVVEQNPAATLPPPGEPMPVLPPSPLTLLPVPVIEESLTATTTPGPEVPATTTTAETTGPTTETTTGPTTETSPSGTSSTETSPATTSPSEGSTSEPATSAPDAATTSPAPSSAPTTTAPATSSTTSAPAATTTTAPSAATTTTTVAPTTSTRTTVTTTGTTVAPPATSAAPEPQQEAPAQAPATTEPAITTELEQSTSTVVTTTTTVPVGEGG